MSEGAMSDWQDSGTHRFLVDGDLLHWQLHGPVLADDIRALWTRNRAIRARYGYALMLIDAREGGTLVPEGRKLIVDFKRSEPDSIGRVGVYGAGLLSRGLVALVSRALALVVKREISVNLCATEAEARAWLDEVRPQAQAAAQAVGKGPPQGGS